MAVCAIPGTSDTGGYPSNGEFGRAKDCFESALSIRRKVCARCDVGWIRVDVWFIFWFAVGLSVVE
jgi:hypothetical protein